MSNIINIGGTSGGSGSSVVPNPQGAATDTLVKLGIEGTIYDFAGSGGHNYSTTEHVVGTWIDGSTLYEKTIDCGSLTNNTEKTVAHGIDNIDKIVETVGNAYSTSLGVAIPLSNAQISTNSAYVIEYSVNATNVIITTHRDRTMYSGYVTIRYTKSTT